MGIRFACHVCAKPLNIKQELAGKRGVCPECGSRFRIPNQDAETSTPIVEKTRPPTRPSEPAISLIQDDPDAVWYVRPPSGGQYGPATGEMLRQWVDQGRVAASSLLWRDGWPQWRPAAEALAEIAEKLPGAGTPESAPFAASKASSAKPSDRETSAQGPPEVAGQSSVGGTRRARSMTRTFWIGTLFAISLALIGVLAFLISQPS